MKNRISVKTISVRISKETYNKLAKLRDEWKCRSISATIDELIKEIERRRTIEDVIREAIRNEIRKIFSKQAVKEKREDG